MHTQLYKTILILSQQVLRAFRPVCGYSPTYPGYGNACPKSLSCPNFMQSQLYKSPLYPPSSHVTPVASCFPLLHIQFLRTIRPMFPASTHLNTHVYLQVASTSCLKSRYARCLRSSWAYIMLQCLWLQDIVSSPNASKAGRE